VSLYPFADYWWLYAGFGVLVVLLLVLDLRVLHRKAHAIGFREAALTTLGWTSLSVVFGLLLYYFTAQKTGDHPQALQATLEFFTGYILELSLSVDNMFVFVLIMGYFAVPVQFQHRVLFYGILGALVFRAIFIALGAVLLQFEWVVYLFGAFLVITGIRMCFGGEKETEPEKNLTLRTLRRILPVTAKSQGPLFFVRENGRLHATPLLLTLALLEVTDVIFAVDSVPAIFGVTREPFIVFTSNIFAILGLRSMYFMLAGAVTRFYLLQYALAIILIFVGLKMAWLNQAWGGKFPIGISLGLIGAVLGASVVISILFPKREA
jgi:tellurite resistance protein TerC